MSEAPPFDVSIPSSVRGPKNQHHLASLGNDIDYSDIATVTNPLDLVSIPSYVPDSI